jgi:uncharacterized protein (TIGR03083 family)
VNDSSATDLPADPITDAYRRSMDRIRDLATGLDDQRAHRIVPATPAWQVRDLLAHVVGVAADVVAGRIEGVATEPWTAAQVEARAGRPVGELLDEWADTWPAFAGILSHLATANPVPARQAVFDVVSHEHDLRGALDRPGARDHDDLSVAWQFAAAAVSHRLNAADSGALVLHPTDGDPVAAGLGEPTATVRATTFELLRAIAGRRSTAQISAWTWDGPPAPEAICVFPPRADDLVE